MSRVDYTDFDQGRPVLLIPKWKNEFLRPHDSDIVDVVFALSHDTSHDLTRYCLRNFRIQPQIVESVSWDCVKVKGQKTYRPSVKALRQMLRRHMPFGSHLSSGKIGNALLAIQHSTVEPTYRWENDLVEARQQYASISQSEVFPYLNSEYQEDKDAINERIKQWCEANPVPIKPLDLGNQEEWFK